MGVPGSDSQNTTLIYTTFRNDISKHCYNNLLNKIRTNQFPQSTLVMIGDYLKIIPIDFYFCSNSDLQKVTILAEEKVTSN